VITLKRAFDMPRSKHKPQARQARMETHPKTIRPRAHAEGVPATAFKELFTIPTEEILRHVLNSAPILL
jgi:hypothetical protein